MVPHVGHHNSATTFYNDYWKNIRLDGGVGGVLFRVPFGSGDCRTAVLTFDHNTFAVVDVFRNARTRQHREQYPKLNFDVRIKTYVCSFTRDKGRG